MTRPLALITFLASICWLAVTGAVHLVRCQSMAHQWKAGDLAVCVDDSRRWLPFDPPFRSGKVYRVEAVNADADEMIFGEPVGLILAGIPEFDIITPNFHCHAGDGWVADRFHPILPAEPCFTEAMRSLRPKVEA